MVFSSLAFIGIFMPIFFGCYYICRPQYRNSILLIGSLLFYFVGTIHQPQHYILFLCCMILDFYVGVWIKQYPKYAKVLLWIAIGMHIMNLFMFKYFGFVLGQIQNRVIEIVLPIGISFYTFQGISYVVDVYRNKVNPEQSLLRFCVYIAMFEQLIAGPIVKYDQVKEDLMHRKITLNLVKQGLYVFVFGLGLKVLLANPLGKLYGQVCAIGFDSISTPLAWMSIIAYSLQIYLDFFGYSLMAIGLGKMLGFHLPKNFNHPYISKSMSEFWRRWHMTLGSWFKEYVYIPLGGNKKGSLLTIRNLFIVWLCTGIWHGAGYSFLLWGLTLFVIITLEKYVFHDFLKKHEWFAHVYMMLLIPLTWAIFACDRISDLTMLYSRLFPFFTHPKVLFPLDYMKYLKMYYPFLIMGILFSTLLPYRWLRHIQKKKYVIEILLLIVLCASVYCMYKGLEDPFLYFRF